jgi:hypothetical protein
MLQVSLELKVCEGCSGLWVRPLGEQQPYCVRCRARLAPFPRRTRRKRAQARPCRGAGMTIVPRKQEGLA